MGVDPSAKARAVAPDVSAIVGHLQPLFKEMQDKLAAQLQAQLQEGLAKLGLTLQPTAPPAYPDSVSKEALARLEQDPEIPDFTRSSVRALSFCLEHLQDEQAQMLIQSAYTDLLSARQSVLPPQAQPASPMHRPSQSRTSSAHRSGPPTSRLVHQNGVTYYRTNTGRMYDISRPPPYPCKVCNVSHWSWECPRNSK